MPTSPPACRSAYSSVLQYTLFARTFDESGASKVTAFIANRDEHEGIFPGPPEKKLGIRGSNTCVVTFDKCRIPAENILG